MNILDGDALELLRERDAARAKVRELTAELERERRHAGMLRAQVREDLAPSVWYVPEDGLTPPLRLARLAALDPELGRILGALLVHVEGLRTQAGGPSCQ